MNHKWSHISCIRWIFRIYSKDIHTNFNFEENLPEWRILNKCDLCIKIKINEDLIKNKCVIKVTIYNKHLVWN